MNRRFGPNGEPLSDAFANTFNRVPPALTMSNRRAIAGSIIIMNDSVQSSSGRHVEKTVVKLD